ncbi:hypothetical protein [Phenylobacterium sp.]|uniref:hypothetical protein n=1 Tax=Phenylobacterium sp. TaxID=1871053 RepID=UPI0025D6DBD4|nr:hypothetical protein [Phenylobacterium sp.]MBX3484085.1 hypothetical protein [Phenylobacterium sp.]MCW5761416.1 hypothetical protein [Phenylobacterium sp.]
MLISALAAVVLFAAPETVQSGEAAKMAVQAKPEMKRVCETIEVSGSNLPKKKCRNVPVKAAAKPGEDAADKAPTKPE